MRISFWSIVALMALVIGCTKSGLDAKAVTGVYKVKYSHGSETLFLGDNGQFTQTYLHAENHQPETNSGTWEIDKEFDEVRLNGGILFDDREGRRAKHFEKTIWRLPIVKRFGEVSLQIDGDGFLEYNKVNK